jgi:VanZ family protein
MGVSRRIRRRICAAYLLALTAASLFPSWWFPPSTPQFSGADKLVHVAMYAIFSALVYWAAEPSPWRKTLWLPMALALYGLFMEGLQLGLGWGMRSFEWLDAVANLAGSLAGWIWLSKRSSPAAEEAKK